MEAGTESSVCSSAEITTQKTGTNAAKTKTPVKIKQGKGVNNSPCSSEVTIYHGAVKQLVPELEE